ncbi:ATP-dependent DNA helicase RecG [Enterobacter cloacae]|uniref:ATP-dependent DNA helicase RecG n=1 Tax=Enterobacter cloacae TaxID=550 RepID=A0A377LNT3_ENTCL|nr:ATP-dependent DNA helicase RecG [Enterobacter cloacae]
MTATPIPRTLAMTAYADLDTSTIDELPPGRTPVTTVAIPDTRRSDIIDRVRNACTHEGRQAYWVCTLIEESDLLEAQAAEATWEELKLALPELKVGLVHGRMKPAEKQAVMQSFKQGELHLLVRHNGDRSGRGCAKLQPDDHRKTRSVWGLRSYTSCVAAWAVVRCLTLRSALQSPALKNRADAFAGTA